MTPPASHLDRARLMQRRVDFFGCSTLVFIRPDGVVDSVLSFSPRAQAIQESAGRSGYRIVGTYAPGVTAEQIVGDVREALA